MPEAYHTCGNLIFDRYQTSCRLPEERLIKDVWVIGNQFSFIKDLTAKGQFLNLLVVDRGQYYQYLWGEKSFLNETIKEK